MTLLLEASLLFILLLFSGAKTQGSLSEGLILGRISCPHRQGSGKLLALTGFFPLFSFSAAFAYKALVPILPALSGLLRE